MKSLCLTAMLLVPSVAAADTGAEAELDQIFLMRDQKDAVAKVEAIERRASGQAPSYGILWRLSRFWSDAALRVQDLEEMKRLAKRGWDHADHAVRLEPKRVEGHLYGAVSIGQYSEGLGIVSALMQGIEGKFNQRIDAALRIDPSFGFGAPLVVKGRYYFRLPWPKRNLKRARELLSRAVEAFPTNVRARVYYAEVLIEDDALEEARRQLEAALSSTEVADPIDAAAARVEAKRLQGKHQER